MVYICGRKDTRMKKEIKIYKIKAIKISEEAYLKIKEQAKKERRSIKTIVDLAFAI